MTACANLPCQAPMLFGVNVWHMSDACVSAAH